MRVNQLEQGKPMSLMWLIPLTDQHTIPQGKPVRLLDRSNCEILQTRQNNSFKINIFECVGVLAFYDKTSKMSIITLARFAKFTVVPVPFETVAR